MADEQLAFDLTLDATPVDVFYAFATAQGWRNWMCDSARFEPRERGSYQLAWSSGWFTSGSVKKIAPGVGLEMTWLGKDDASTTEVSINLEARDGGTKLSIRNLAEEVRRCVLQILCRKVKVKCEAMKEGETEIRRFSISARRAQKELGFVPRMSFGAGLQRLIESVAHGRALRGEPSRRARHLGPTPDGEARDGKAQPGAERSR